MNVYFVAAVTRKHFRKLFEILYFDFVLIQGRSFPDNSGIWMMNNSDEDKYRNTELFNELGIIFNLAEKHVHLLEGNNLVPEQLFVSAYETLFVFGRPDEIKNTIESLKNVSSDFMMYEYTKKNANSVDFILENFIYRMRITYKRRGEKQIQDRGFLYK